MFGEPTSPTELVAYVDDRPARVNERGERWAYCGVLLLPTSHLKETFNLLENVRTDHTRSPTSGAPRPVEFTELTTLDDPRTGVAREWLRHVALDDEDRFHLAMIGINHDNLDRTVLTGNGSSGSSSQYHRFFLTALAREIQACFDETESLHIKKAFRDASRPAEGRVFPWRTVWPRLERFPSLEEVPDELLDLSPRPDRPDGHRVHSVFLQLLDVLLGATRQCLDDPNDRRGSIHAASGAWLDLLGRLSGPGDLQHPDSPYRHLNRLSLSFFPVDQQFLLNEKLSNYPDGHYRTRSCLLRHRLNEQYSLF